MARAARQWRTVKSDGGVVGMSDERAARVSPAGAAVFLTSADLEELGVDPETVESIAYSVRDGDLRLKPGDSP